MRTPTDVKTIAGKARLRIGMPTSNHRDDYIKIDVEDITSGTLVLELEMSAEDFAKITVGNGHLPVDAVWRPGLLGYRHENKREQVPIEDRTPSDRSNRNFAKPEDRARIFGPFEVDGWIGDAPDYFNHHRRSGKNATVGFHRYVNIETGEPMIPESQKAWPEPIGDFKGSARLAAAAAKEKDNEFWPSE